MISLSTTKPANRIPLLRAAQRAYTLPEVLIGVALSSLVLVILLTLYVTGSKNILATSSYLDLDRENRIAAAVLKQNLRAANRLTAASANRIVIETPDGSPMTFTYRRSKRKLVQSHNGNDRVLLEGCDQLTFSLSQRNPKPGAYDVYPKAKFADCKLVKVTWTCSRQLLGGRTQVENATTGHIVIRKQ